jgi:DNA-binding protein YbaB
MAMPSFGQMKDMYKIQRDAKRIKKELKTIHVEAEASGVKIVVSAEQEVVSIEIGPDVARERLPELIKDAMNRAMKKAQLIAAERMQGIMQQMGMNPGALGDEE